MKKRILIILALLCSFAQGAWADKWDGRTMKKPEPVPDYSTASNMYSIACAAELAYVRAHFTEAINDPRTNFKTWNEARYRLDADLDMSHKGWEPLGHNGGSPVDFNGKFDGNGHSIEVLSWPDSENYQGLFARIGTAGEVCGVIIKGALRYENTRLVGGIAGENLGNINNCWVEADISSNWHESWSFYTAKIGGIAGENAGKIECCLVTGNVRNDDADVGGLVGYNKGSVTNCTFYGTRSSSHKQHSVYFGDVSSDAWTSLLYSDELLNDGELRTYLSFFGNEQFYLYARGIQEPFVIRPVNWGSVPVSVSAKASRATKTITVTYPEGSVVADMAIQDYDGNPLKYELDREKRTYTFEMPKRKVNVYATVNYPALTLWSDRDNSEQLAVSKGKKVDAALDGRTFFHDGNWNTLCLPFNVPSFDETPLSGATVQELTDARVDGGTLILTFSPVTSIEAGKPYIVKWKPGRNTTKAKFVGVTPVSDAPIPVTFGGVTFTGRYSVLNITSENIDQIIMLTDKNTLGYSAAPRLVGSFRCHFTVSSDSGAQAVTKVVIK